MVVKVTVQVVLGLKVSRSLSPFLPQAQPQRHALEEMSHTDTAVAEHAPVAKVYRWSAQDGTVRAYIGFSYIEYSRTSFTAVAEHAPVEVGAY
jgi:hypothetical protein